MIKPAKKKGPVVVERIPVERWGKDHWSMLAYVETRAVDYGGKVDPRHLRENPLVSPPRGNPMPSNEHPTRLVDGEKVSPHDDWCCIEDLIAFGLLVWEGTGANPIFRLTARGWAVVSALRQHKAKGGTFATFRIELAGALPEIIDTRDPLDDAAWLLPEPWMEWAEDGKPSGDGYYVHDNRGGNNDAWRYLGTKDIRGAMSDQYPVLPEIILARNLAAKRLAESGAA